MVPVIMNTVEHCHFLIKLNGSVDIDGCRDCMGEGGVVAGGDVN